MVALMLLELGFEAFEQREGIRGAAGNRQDAVVIKPPDLPGAGLDDDVVPSVTWPSPPRATCCLWRTESMVVPWYVP